jgi:hypothetical protein
MLPSAYAVPAAIVFVIGGALSCFAGYRLFRVVLGINGFILGALIASSMMGPHSTLVLAVAAVVGGLIGAVVLVAGYFVGVALVGAGLGALAINFAWKPFGGDPHWIVVVIAATVGALVALAVTRYMIVVGTAFGGAWTLLYGAFALAGDRTISLNKVWAVYPLSPAPGRWWVMIVWFGLGITGVIAQLAFTSRKRK